MKRLVGILHHGDSLRHRPVALARDEQRPVRVIAVGEAERDVTEALFPASLNPLVLGVARCAGEAPARLSGLRMRDAASGQEVGSIALAPSGIVNHPAVSLDLFVPTGAGVRCVSAAYRALRYAAAWRHAQLSAKRPHDFRMSFADLRALNVFYMMPRPVFLVSVMHGERGNLFPMDLVGPWGDDLFIVALRTTSRSIEIMLDSGRIAFSAMAGRHKDTIYRLGSQHRVGSIDWNSVELEMTPSPLFAIPVPVDSLRLRELEILHSEVIGSHRLFVTRIAGSFVKGTEPQLCHVSDMYARWRAARGTPFIDA